MNTTTNTKTAADYAARLRWLESTSNDRAHGSDDLPAIDRAIEETERAFAAAFPDDHAAYHDAR